MQRIPVSEHLHGTELRLHGLMLRGLDGDAAAYRSFLQATSGHLRAFLRRRLQRWPDEVEDLVQECLLAIHNQRLTYDTNVPLTSWIHAIARYKLIDWLRRHARREAQHLPYDEEDGTQELFSSADAEAAEASRDLGKLLASLPAQQRDAIVHTKLDGWSVRDTAAAMQISEASVKVAVHRGLKALAANLRTGNEGIAS
ncbi:sigma-70 family RNA polymerase sigma factor [Janthinobacterium sp. PLB04]|uniref:Sigma-70 family RNA polymerase sigma factor n=1 Tax=Janthinobacterium lividum TaxID=29581 RepID=A0AAJ4T3F3_9BURK|nr:MULTISPECIES: sigma-70 family RNA polymerase sigma factor [Janthinobacterium]KAB0325294.1 sigma-70 family RNA polymerase sigma factor [Janthinobacterium lividum]QSX94384.1 sigma-70 family RNA polymerase sigma factor [Janthinobacterium lividum]UGQ34167.1 sigma-70 family RNA polymerase sigma factor [Janthinobacterium sp. PLB04]